MRRLLLLLVLGSFITIPKVDASTQQLFTFYPKPQLCSPGKFIHEIKDGVHNVVFTRACSTSDYILENYNTEEYLVMNPSNALSSGDVIKIREVTRERILKLITIPYNTEREYTKTLPHRKEKVLEKGINGKAGKIIEVIHYKNGSSSRFVVDEWIEREPQTKKVKVGTIYDLQKTKVNGDVIYYWKTLEVLATSYDRNCYGCSDTTATGAKLKKGIIAVDPTVIPLHTKMYVPGYGFGQAEDVGGAVKGNKIDLGFYDLSNGEWSRRWVTIYIID